VNRRGAAAGAVLVLLLPGVCTGARRPTFDDPAFRAADAAWTACFGDSPRVPQFPSRPDPEDYGAGLAVRRTTRGFRVDAFASGNGVEAGYTDITIDFEPQGCRALWSIENAFDGALGSRVEAGWVNRGAPTEAEVRDLIAEPARADDAGDAFARAWLGHRCAGGPDSDLAWDRAIEGPIAPTQPAHDGPPLRAPRTFWSAAALDAIGASGAARHFDDDDDDDDDEGTGAPRPRKDVQLDGVSIPPIGRPRPTFATRRYQLFEATIPGRNEGKAIALLDRAANRHRWVVVTRGCVQGTTVSWLGTVGDRIVGVTNSRHGRYAEGDAILVIDAPTATAWAIRLPDNIRDRRFDSDGKVRASLSRSVLSLRAARAKAKIDLAPLLAQIPAR
jgi:hypothetical protein